MQTNRFILHAHYHRAFALANEFIKGNINGKNIMLIIGPTGVGKTTLRRQLLRTHYGNPLNWEPGKLRCIEVMATQTENSYFKSSALAENIHRELFSPDLRFLKPTDAGEDFDTYCRTQMHMAANTGLNINYRNTPETRVWPIISMLAKQRCIELISIEHADALSKNHANQVPAEHVRNIMSVNEDIGSKLIFTSATNGYKLYERDREVCDRMFIVPLYPYDLQNSDEANSFLKLLFAISLDFEFEPHNLFKSMYREIAAVTGTTIRDVFSLFAMARSIAHISGRAKITKSDLMSAMPSLADCRNTLADIALFREKVRPCSAGELKFLVNQLGASK